MQEIRGERKVNRSQDFGRNARIYSKITAKENWFSKARMPNQEPDEDERIIIRKVSRESNATSEIPPETVIFVPFTPEGQLKKSIQAIDDLVMGNQKAGRVKVVETLGNSFLNSLGNQAPWKSETCGRPKCLPCMSKLGSCLKANVTYNITCQICAEQGILQQYWGESHRTWWDRFQDHKRALENLGEKYATVKHHLNHHANVPPNFKYKLHKTWKSTLERQVGEALEINSSPPESLMNSKSEWGHNALPRITVLKDPREPPDPPENQPAQGPGQIHHQHDPQQNHKNTRKRPSFHLIEQQQREVPAAKDDQKKKAKYQIDDFFRAVPHCALKGDVQHQDPDLPVHGRQGEVHSKAKNSSPEGPRNADIEGTTKQTSELIRIEPSLLTRCEGLQIKD